MLRLIFVTLLFSFNFTLTAQVVNTEKLRLNTEKAWVGSLDLNFGLSRNKAGQTLSFGTQARTEWRRQNSRWMLLGGYNLTQFNNIDDPGSAPKNFTNRAFGHLRYNYLVNEWLTIEAFSQAQYDEIQEVDIRLLNGVGPRFQLIRTDSTQLYLGTLYMYEYEETSETEVIVYNKDHRLSAYLSGGFQPTSYLTIDLVTYFQPNLGDFSDYRISSETSLSVKIARYVSLKTYFQLVYDTNPPLTVPKTMYMLSNGLGIAF